MRWLWQSHILGRAKRFFAKIMRDYIVLNPDIQGLYHVSDMLINEYDLLKLIDSKYKGQNKILPEDNFIIDRSLNVDNFIKQIVYCAPSWPELI